MRNRRADHEGRRRVVRDRGREVLVDPADVAGTVDRPEERDPRRDSGRHEAARREGGVTILDLEHLPGSPSDRWVSLLLLLGVWMDATEFSVELDRSDGTAPRLRTRYFLDASSGEPKPVPDWMIEEYPELARDTREENWIFRELDPLSEEILPPIVRVLRWLAGVDSPRRRLAWALRRLANVLDGGPIAPQFGRFDVAIGGSRINVFVGVCPSKDGDRFLIRLNAPASSSS